MSQYQLNGVAGKVCTGLYISSFGDLVECGCKLERSQNMRVDRWGGFIKWSEPKRRTQGSGSNLVKTSTIKVLFVFFV